MPHNVQKVTLWTFVVGFKAIFVTCFKTKMHFFRDFKILIATEIEALVDTLFLEE